MNHFPNANQLRFAANSPKPARQKVPFVCDDCGKVVKGEFRELCPLCGAELDGFCANRHLYQHPKECWK